MSDEWYSKNDSTPCRRGRTGPLPRSLAERFWEKVAIGSVDECWPWQACTYHHGYGKFALRRSKPVYAHRVAFELAYDPIPDGLLVCHTCDNRRCCNPKHLFLVTQKDNMQDCKSKGRNSLPPPTKKSDPLWQQSDTLVSLYQTGNYRQVDLAKMFNTSQSRVSFVIRSVLDGKNV